MGMTKAEITRKLDEIVDFSGVERYIDTPVKRYSSGMTVRLGFAIAAHLEPEILVVDEVLAVGDAEFQKKAIGKMQDVSKGEGRTVLFVSHNMDAIKKLCNSCVLLKDGNVSFTGTTNDVIDYYIMNNQNSNYKIFNKSISEAIYLKEAILYGEKKVPTKEILIGEQWRVKIKFQINKEIQNTVFGIGITTATEIPINTTWSSPQNLKVGTYEIDFISETLFFQKGNFKVLLGISKGDESIYYDDEFLQFEVALISKDINDNLIRIDGSTGIILNQLRTVINKV
jgi:lipopolysaccharide transport system ATP-binding protein